MSRFDTKRPISLNIPVDINNSCFEEKELNKTILSRDFLDNTHAVNTGEKIYSEFKTKDGSLYASCYDIKTQIFDVQKLENDGSISPATKFEDFLPSLMISTFSVLNNENLEKFNSSPKDLISELTSSIKDISGPDTIFNVQKVNTKHPAGMNNVENLDLFSRNISVNVSDVDNLISTLTPQNASFFAFETTLSPNASSTNDLISVAEQFSLNPLTNEQKLNISNSGFVPNELFMDILTIASMDIGINAEKRAAGIPVAPVSGYFYGPSSGGKTRSTEMIASLLNIPFRSIECHPQTNEKEFLFSTEINRENDEKGYIHETYKKESPLIDVLKNGGICLIDEANNIGNPNVLTALNEILSNGIFQLPPSGTKIKYYDESKGFYISDGGTLPIHENAIIIFAGNDCYGKSLPTSVLDRANQNGLVASFDIPTGDVMLTRLLASPAYQKTLDAATKTNNLSSKQLSQIDEALKKLASSVQEYNDSVLEELSSYSHSSSGENFITSRDFNSVVTMALTNIDSFPSFQHALLNCLTSDVSGLTAKHRFDRGSVDFKEKIQKVLAHHDLM